MLKPHDPARPRPRTTHLVLLALCTGVAVVAEASAQKPARPRPQRVFHRVAAGDFDGNGRHELVRWSSVTGRLEVWDMTQSSPKKLTEQRLAGFPCILRTADLDGDGADELIVGAGLRGYNKKGQPPVDIRVLVYKPLRRGSDGWKVETVFTQKSQRPTVTAMAAADLDGDKRPELLFAGFVSKYFTEVHVATRQNGRWAVGNRGRVRMGMSVAAAAVRGAGRPVIAVGRPYGDKLGQLGDVFLLLQDNKRVVLPAFRGVSSLAAGDVDGDGVVELLVGDGWHQNYGRLARARLTVLHQQDDGWRATPVEDLPAHTRIVEIMTRDLDGDGRAEVLVRGERSRSLGGAVRLYQCTGKGWRGQTLATDVQGFAIGRFRGKRMEILLAGQDSGPKAMALDRGWDTALTPASNPVVVDAQELIGKPAPALQITSWVSGKPRKLADLRGKVVLLDFWATWCRPCIAAFPTLCAWQKRFGDKLVVIGVTNHDGQTEARIKMFLKQQKLPWPVAVDPRKRPHQAYGVGPIPHLVVIDTEGIVRLTHVGSGGLQKVQQTILKLLAR